MTTFEETTRKDMEDATKTVHAQMEALLPEVNKAAIKLAALASALPPHDTVKGDDGQEVPVCEVVKQLAAVVMRAAEGINRASTILSVRIGDDMGMSFFDE